MKSLVLLLALISAGSAFAQQAEHLVISEVRYYETSGVNEEFVEIYNPANFPVELNGYRIQYKSSGGVNWSDKASFTANHVIQGKGFMLFGGSATSVTPDISSAVSVGLGNSGGHVRLLDAGDEEIDRVGWGAADSPEGTALGSHPRGGSFERKAFENSTAASMESGGADELEGNSWDSDDNSSDFVAHDGLSTANPQNSSSPIEPDVPLVDGSGTVTVDPTTIMAPGPEELEFTFEAGDTLLTRVQIELPEGWTYTGYDHGDGAFDEVVVDADGSLITITEASLEGAVTGTFTLEGLMVPTASGIFQITVRTATEDGTLAIIQGPPTVQVIGDPMPMSALHENDNDGIPDLLGNIVVVRGVVTLADELGIAAYLQDETGGIVAYDAAFAESVDIGDDVTVVGTLVHFNGLAELTPATIVETHATGVEVDPEVVTCSDIADQGAGGEPWEGMLVRLNGITVEGAGVWAGNTNYTIADGTGSTTLRVDSDCDLVGLPIPGDAFDVIVNVAQYDFSAPHTSGYQVLPRFASDVIQSGGPTITGGPWESERTRTSLRLSWTTSTASNTIVTWGATDAHEIDSVAVFESVTDHGYVIDGLEPGSIYHVRCGSEDANGASFTSDFLVATVSPATSPGTIEVFFTQGVETDLATEGNEANGDHDVVQEVLDLIDGAESSLDCAIYSLNIFDIADAIIDAHDRGVAVRFIYDADHDQGEVAQIANAGITVIDNSFGSNGLQGIQHNKFFIVDAADADPSNDKVWTGSLNLLDAPGSVGIHAKQNSILIADQALARAYTLEFNEMWGSDGMNPSAPNSRFGEFKTDNTPHHFIVGGRPVDLWFSKGDFVSQQMRNLIDTADESVYFGILAFTLNDVNYSMRDRFEDDDVAVRGVFDDEGDQFSEFSDMQGWGADIHTDAGSGILHHKYLLVDADYPEYGPAVWTGSFNFSSSANERNDENVVVIHDAAIANQYLQEFAEIYHNAGGTHQFMVSDVDENTATPESFRITGNWPNPFNPATTLAFELPVEQALELSVYNLQGRRVMQQSLGQLAAGQHQLALDLSAQASGVYFVRLAGEQLGTASRKVLLVK